MKAHELINDMLSEWRAIRHAPDLAHELFDRLDTTEIERLAVAAFAGEIRKALRRKRDGVPVYANVDVIDAGGNKARRFKQCALFDADDFRIAVASYTRRGKENLKVAQALAKAAKARFGVQLRLDETKAS